MLVDAYKNIPNLRFCLWFSLGFLISTTVTKVQKAQCSSGKNISETGAILNHGSLLD